MTSKELELALRDSNTGCVKLSIGSRLQIIRMLYGVAKPAKGGFRIHTSLACLQIVFGNSEACQCGLEGEIVFFKTGSAGQLADGTYDVQPLGWTDNPPAITVAANAEAN